MPGKSSEWVAIILAAGIVLALMIMTGAALWGAINHMERGLSENATQVLTGWGGGIIGVLGAYVGYIRGGNNGKPPTTGGPTP